MPLDGRPGQTRHSVAQARRKSHAEVKVRRMGQATGAESLCHLLAVVSGLLCRRGTSWAAEPTRTSPTWMQPDAMEVTQDVASSSTRGLP